MNILNKLTIKNLKLNKKRSLGTIIGIILSVALICAVSNMVSSFRETLIQNAINESGYWHIRLYNVSNDKLKRLKLNKDIDNIYTISEDGYAKLDTIKNEYKPYLKFYGMNKEAFNNLEFKLIKGRFPKNDNEIIISEHLNKNGKANLKIDDEITVNVGDRVTLEDDYVLNDSNPFDKGNEIIKNPNTKKYRVVGIIKRPDVSFEPMSAPAYTTITTSTNKDNFSVFISLKNPRDKNSFVELLGARNYDEVVNMGINNPRYDYTLNNELLRWEALKFSDSTFSMLLSIAEVVIFIIIFTSIFCIRNSFAISTTEKMRMYGMLSSVGATKKQIKKSVLTEGFILGLIAIPIGIICGIIAVFVLLKIVNLFLGDFLFNNIDGMVFKVSFVAIIISIILGFVTIYFSAISSAKKASKVSPIDNLRNTNDIKISSKKLKTPKLIKNVFKTGGVLAYKNLKRSKKKYRTTVVSLTVSIFVFISMFTFINEGFKQSGNYYQNYDYNYRITFNNNSSMDEINEIRNLDSVNASYLVYYAKPSILIDDISKINPKEPLECEYDKNDKCIKKYARLNIILLDDSTFKSYVKKVKGNYDYLKDKSILTDMYRFYDNKSKKEYEDRIYTYKSGDTIDSKLLNEDNISIDIGLVSNIMPYGFENVYSNGGYIVLNNKYFNNIDYYGADLMIDSSDTEQLTNNILNMDDELNYYDMDEEAKAEKSIVIVISIFLYGFICVITLIGVTNIFNTITSNMELRQKEFAMLKSVGMTKKEFNHMINLETLFYSSKSLIYGSILGIIGSYFVHRAFAGKIDTQFVLPYKAILICILFVFIVVYMIMKYSMNKINKQNMIETIRKENI
ncbi:aBC-type antimicrobial peptide transport system permease component [Clostridium sp. CAG:710]|nr:aBC-type antimicrobial peptide transport system permease component [Clostridium sp. CAG:710]